MFASDLKALQESYEGIYEEGDGISCEMLEEIVEELIEECVEFGYSLNEASTAVENAQFYTLMRQRSLMVVTQKVQSSVVSVPRQRLVKRRQQHEKQR